MWFLLTCNVSPLDPNLINVQKKLDSIKLASWCLELIKSYRSNGFAASRSKFVVGANFVTF